MSARQKPPPPALPAVVAAQLGNRFLPRPQLHLDPREWVRKRQPGVCLWSSQYEILESVRDHRNTAVKSCHSAGKSFTAAEAVCWWIDSHDPGEAFVITSAPTGDQVKAILWREVGRAHRRGGLPGRTNLTEWYLGDELVALGRKPNDYEPTAFQGIHARYVLVVLDEACGIPKTLWDAASTLASNEHSRVLAIGNPDDPQSHFATVCKLPSWNVITIPADATPNFTGEDVPDSVREVLLSKVWVEEKAEEWGEDSPLYQAKILARFPVDAEDGVIPGSWLARARRTELPPDEWDEPELGFDVAGGGGDRAVIWLRRGPRAERRWDRRGEKDPAALAEWALSVILETGARRVKVDAIGVGWGVCGTLDAWAMEGKHNCDVVPVSVSEASTEPEKLLNLRAQLWWQAREACRLGQWDLRALDDDDAADLAAPKYHTRNPHRRIQVESKDDVRKRIKRSTDSADALLLAFHDAFMEAELYLDYATQTRIDAARR